MSQFNLIDEPWIPVRDLQGKRMDLGIRDTLLRAAEFAEIEDPSPLVVAALYRFLLAVLYRALMGPTDIDQAKKLFRYGLPTDKIQEYLEKWRERFFLFDEKYPFFQIPSFDPRIWRTWTVLAAEHNADNAKVLFDHIDVSSPGQISPRAVARWMLATQTFSVSCGKSELAHTGTAPSATAAMVVPIGHSLLDSLLFCLVEERRTLMEVDLPVWERDPEHVDILRRGEKRPEAGLADRYTWRTRSVRLKPSADCSTSQLAFASGVGLDETGVTDPMLGYRVDEKRGKLPIQFRERGLWRDFDSLLPDAKHVSAANRLVPGVIDHAIALARHQRDRFPKSILVLGQSNDKAKIEFWRMEQFILPEATIGERNVRAEIRGLLDKAEDSQKALWLSCRSYARDVLSRGAREPDAKDVRSFVQQLPAIGSYWSVLEGQFHELLREFHIERDPDDIRQWWLKVLRNALKSTWAQTQQSVSGGDAWSIRAIVKAEVAVRRKLRELDEDIAKLEPQKEVA